MKYLLTILLAITLSAICNTLTAQEKSIEVSLDVENVNGVEQRNFTVTIGDGNNEKEITWKDNGVIPAEVKAQLEKEGVNIKMLEGDGEVEVTVESDGDKKIEKEVEIIKIHSEESEGHHIQDREISIDDNDSDIRVIKLKAGEELPSDIQQILEDNDIDINQLIEEGINESQKKDLKVVEKKIIKIKTKDGDGNETLMEWNGEGETPEDIMKLLEKEGIDLESEGEQKMIFISKDSDATDIKISKETKSQYRIKTIDEQGNEKIIEWNGEGEMPEEMKEHKHMFKEKKIEIRKGSGNKAQLGIMIEEGDYGIGVKVIDVVDGSPADKVGIKKDYIITRVNDKEIDSIDDLLSTLEPFKPGENILIDFMYHDTYTGGVEVTLGGATQETANVYIFENAIEGENFDMFKKVEKCDENGNVTAIVKVKKIASDNEKLTSPEAETRSIPVERQLELKAFSVFPNPTTNNINISFQGNSESTVVQVTDISGKEIFKDVVDDFSGSYNKDLDLSNYAKGQYILYVIQNQKVFTESIILQ